MTFSLGAAFTGTFVIMADATDLLIRIGLLLFAFISGVFAVRGGEHIVPGTTPWNRRLTVRGRVALICVTGALLLGGLHEWRAHAARARAREVAHAQATEIEKRQAQISSLVDRITELRRLTYATDLDFASSEMNVTVPVMQHGPTTLTILGAEHCPIAFSLQSSFTGREFQSGNVPAVERRIVLTWDDRVVQALRAEREEWAGGSDPSRQPVTTVHVLVRLFAEPKCRGKLDVTTPDPLTDLSGPR